jgi:phage gpG-like protein
LHRVTGTLAKSITYNIVNDFNAKVGTNVRYAAIHEFGGTINAKPGGALHFKIKDSWVTTKSVVIPARPYLSPSIEYVFQHEAPSIMNKLANEFLGKEWYKK